MTDAAAPRVVLVLGGGGATGHAFHVGFLAALEQVLGWSANDADLIIGTSAGASVAALIRSGVSLSRMVAELDGSTRPARSASSGSDSDPRLFGRARLRIPSPLPMAPGLATRAFTAEERPLTRAAALAFAPTGRASIDRVVAGIEFHQPREWPTAATWIPAVSLRTGRRRVFGLDSGMEEVTLARAAAASSAVPSYYEPVVINGERFVDGGVASATNVDLVAERNPAPSLVIVSSPMSDGGLVGGAGSGASGGNPIARIAGRSLTRDLDELRDALGSACPVVAVAPDAACRDAMGLNPMDASRRPATCTAAIGFGRTLCEEPAFRMLVGD